MSKPAREYLDARLKDIIQRDAALKERDAALELATKGRTKVPDSYYENPNGYMLLPEYSSAVRDVQLSEAVRKHWLTQKVALTNGKEWRDLEMIQDPRTGAISFKQSDPKPFSEEALAFVEENFVEAVSQYQNMLREKVSIEQGFIQQSKARAQTAENITQEIFPAEVWEL